MPASRGTKRTKKSADQVSYLNDLYLRLGGKWDGKVRKEAMAKTGLSRIQIYKWFFDRQLQEKSKAAKDSSSDKSLEAEEAMHSEAEDSQPLFLVEKIN